jgi:hypothetical protein
VWGRQASRKDTGAADNYISCARDAGRARGGGNGRPAAMTMRAKFFGSQRLCFFAGPAAAACCQTAPSRPDRPSGQGETRSEQAAKSGRFAGRISIRVIRCPPERGLRQPTCG